MQTSNNTILYVLIGLALFYFLAPKKDDGPSPPPKPGPGPVVPDVVWPQPSPGMQAAVSGVQAVALNADPTASQVVGLAWIDYAEALSAAGAESFKTTDQFNAALTDFHALLFGKMAGANIPRIAGYGDAVEQSFTKAFGEESAAYDHAKAVDFIRALAWAHKPAANRSRSNEADPAGI